MPTLFIGGAKTKGLLPKVLHTLAAHVPNSKVGDDTEHHASDVRAGTTGIFRNRTGFSGGLNMQTIKVNGYDMAYLEVGSRPSAGLRARHARRFPHLVCRARAAVEEAPGDRGQPPPLLSRALEWRRRRLPHGAACRRRDRLHRAARSEAGRSDGPFARRAHFLPRRAAAARPVAQGDPGRARRRSRRHARSRRRAGRAVSTERARPRSPSTRSGMATSKARCKTSSTASTAKAPGGASPPRPSSNCATISYTLLGQQHEARKPYSMADVLAIKTPTLLIGGADTTGALLDDVARNGRAHRRRQDRHHPERQATGCSSRTRKAIARW